jgi:hypothetical protein
MVSCESLDLPAYAMMHHIRVPRATENAQYSKSLQKRTLLSERGVRAD